MGTHYGLSDIEYELMKFFWDNTGAHTFSEVLRYCHEEMHADWAQTTLHTYLTRLIQKGVLSSERNGYRRSYCAKVSEQELSHNYANQFMKETYHGSIKNLLISLTYQTSLSQEEVDELKQLLDSSISSEE